MGANCLLFAASFALSAVRPRVEKRVARVSRVDILNFRWSLRVVLVLDFIFFIGLVLQA